jgi:hypothetical protein
VEGLALLVVSSSMALLFVLVEPSSMISLFFTPIHPFCITRPGVLSRVDSTHSLKLLVASLKSQM